jgi:hypothetical protein
MEKEEGQRRKKTDKELCNFNTEGVTCFEKIFTSRDGRQIYSRRSESFLE